LPLANKLASLLAALVVRDFPQRWTTCIQDLFQQLWSETAPLVGNRMCLQVLQLVAEDCTDSDFNAKVRTAHSSANDFCTTTKRHQSSWCIVSQLSLTCCLIFCPTSTRFNSAYHIFLPNAKNRKLIPLDRFLRNGGTTS
jgi:hypothetical protein